MPSSVTRPSFEDTAIVMLRLLSWLCMCCLSVNFYNVSDPDVHILCELASKWAQRDVKLERGEDAEGR